MASKFPWTAVAIIIVAAVAVGAWAVLGVPSEEPQTEPQGAATVSVVSTNVVFGAGEPAYSGIENVYIMKHGDFDNATDLKEHANILEYSGTDAVITASGATVNVPYNTLFDIVVAVKVDNDNCYDVTSEDNYQVTLITGAPASISENSTNVMETTHTDSGDGDYVRVNVVWDNSGTGYLLLAEESLSITNIDLYEWGSAA